MYENEILGSAIKLIEKLLLIAIFIVFDLD